MVRVAELGGGTPSGLAIVGVALGMKKNGLVIHLTDGDHNSGSSPAIAGKVLKDKGIGIVNVIWGTSNPKPQYYGLPTVGIRSIEQFPDALYGILMSQAKLEKLGG
jgi:hypothetical protein